MKTDKDKVKLNVIENKEVTLPELSLENIVKDTIELKEVLTKETELLRDSKLNEVKDLYSQKINLIARLEIQKELLEKNPEIIRNKPQEVVDSIRLLGDEMLLAARNNFHEVLKAKEVNKRVVEAISFVAAKDKNSAAGYDKNGISTENAAKSSDGKKTSTSAIALDKKV